MLQYKNAIILNQHRKTYNRLNKFDPAYRAVLSSTLIAIGGRFVPHLSWLAAQKIIGTPPDGKLPGICTEIAAAASMLYHVPRRVKPKTHPPLGALAPPARTP